MKKSIDIQSIGFSSYLIHGLISDSSRRVLRTTRWKRGAIENIVSVSLLVAKLVNRLDLDDWIRIVGLHRCVSSVMTCSTF